MIANAQSSPEEMEGEFIFGHRYPERRAVYETIARMSEDARARFDGARDIAFGPHAREQMNLFPAGVEAPLVVFIHGGYWRSQDRRNYDFVSIPFRACGFSVAVPGYPIAPGAAMADIVQSLRTMLIWLRERGSRHGVSTRALYLSGHSAGGHLAAVLASEAVNEAKLPPVRGCLAVSGIYDLRPLLATSVNNDIRLDIGSAERFSPILRRAGAGWLLAVYGADETAVFQRQAFAYTRRWAEGGNAADFLPIAERNHYNILLDLASTESRIALALDKKAAADRQAALEAARRDHGQAAIRQF